MKRIYFVLLFFITILATAQQPLTGKLSIRALNDSLQPVEGATAELLRVSDSKLIKTAVTDRTGEAVFERVAAGAYKVKFSMINLLSAETPPFQVDKDLITLAPVTLKPGKISELQSVTVTGKKPFIQRLSDRIVVNVESSIISAGSSALEVLERSPGVTIDQNDQLALRGRAGVIIMIDGKRTPLTGADLAIYLRGLPANAIDRIDIITNPSAKYDAAGNSGIIDIHMKKDQRLGANGTFTAGYGQGVYPKANAGTTFNYRNKSLNIFGNYNYAHRVNLNNLILDRNFFTDGVFNGQDKKNNYSKMPVNSHNARIGADFFAGKNTIIGFVVNSNFIHFVRDNNNHSLVIDKDKQPSFTFRTNATNNDHNNNAVGNLNFKHSFDTTGRELTADIDYGVYSSNSLSSTATSYFKLDGTTLQPDYILNGDQEGQLKIRTGKFDYVHPLKNGLRISVGGKTSYVSSDNDAKFFDVSTGVPVNDTTKTNHFFYEEGNNAGYINLNKQFKKFDLQVGLRGEQTNIKTHQVKGDIKWDSGYFQIFPSAFLNYKLKEDQSLGLSLSRRIDRPGYNDLNPFLFLIDVSTYATGNPSLLPQLTWSYELNYTFKNLNFTFGYSHTRDVQNIAIVRLSDVFPKIQLTDPNITVQIPVNLESSDYFGISVSAPVRISKWWNMTNNADIYYNHFNADLAGTNLNNGAPAADIRTNNSFTFPKGWGAELNGSFNSGGRYGYMVSEPRWGISAGAQKSVMKNQGTIRFNITDIFWTNLPKATITYDNYIEYWHAYRDTRVATLSFTYRFGNNKVAAARRRTTGSEEERRRAGGN